MLKKRLLLLSNSKVDDRPILAFAEKSIRQFLGNKAKSVLFIPFAAVRTTYDAYAEHVGARFSEMGYGLTSLHQSENFIDAINRAEAFVVGGGNTFHLLKTLHQFELVAVIREQVLNGIPYIGWSAGANLACPTIKTTNDMPIVDPVSLNALNLIPFQINPHYTEKQIPGHRGETREERINEFLCLNFDTLVIGLREGCLLQVDGNQIELVGPENAKLFQKDREPITLHPGPIHHRLAVIAENSYRLK